MPSDRGDRQRSNPLLETNPFTKGRFPTDQQLNNATTHDSYGTAGTVDSRDIYTNQTPAAGLSYYKDIASGLGDTASPYSTNADAARAHARDSPFR